MRLWLVGGLIVLLVVTAVGYQALQAKYVSDNPIAQAIFTYDVLIRNVVIIDGSGSDRHYGSIGILGDRITAIGPSLSGLARRVIDGKGLFAAPGFIDLGVLPSLDNRKLLMGVTTQVVSTNYPVDLGSMPLGTNLAWLMDLSKQVNGGEDTTLTAAQIQEIAEGLTLALRSGARGAYLPSSSSVAQLMRSESALWSLLGAQGVRLFCQMPTSDPHGIDTITGILARSMAHQVPVHLSGVNLSHPNNWGRVYDVINLIDRAHTNVTGDVVPYYESPQVSERDLVVFVSHPAIAIASGADARHPAIYGTYPRLLQRFVNQEPILSIEEAVAKSCLLPASVLGLTDRGLLRTGYYADIVLFDGSTINAPVDLAKPAALPQGIHTVLVNGRIAADSGRETHEKAGKVLEKNHSQVDK